MLRNIPVEKASRVERQVIVSPMARKRKSAGTGRPFEVPPVHDFDDRATLWLLEDPRNLRDLFRMKVPHLADLLDWEAAVRVNRSFIPADLQKQESDLLFRIPFVPQSQESVVRVLWVYVLLEHQSKPDDLMPLRLLAYMLAVWMMQRREWERQNVGIEGRRLTPILPFVFYTGEANWSYGLDFSAMFDVPAGFEAFIPHWETLFLDAIRTPAETLTGFVNAIGWAIRALQVEKKPYDQVEQTIREAMAGLEGLSAEQRGLWSRVAWYLTLFAGNRRSKAQGEQLTEVIMAQAQASKFYEAEEVRAMYTLADSWKDKGRAEGRAEGKTQGLRSALETVLTERFGALPDAVRAALEAASLDTLNDWLRAAMRAETLQDMGILPENAE
jgi:predicted transposase YdaD